MNRIERTRQAEVDAALIWVYVAERNYDAADRLIVRFDETLAMLADNPHAGEAVDHLKAGLRRFAVGSYCIYFEPLAAGVRVWRILHAARSIDDLLADN